MSLIGFNVVPSYVVITFIIFRVAVIGISVDFMKFVDFAVVNNFSDDRRFDVTSLNSVTYRVMDSGFIDSVLSDVS